MEVKCLPMWSNPIATGARTLENFLSYVRPHVTCSTSPSLAIFKSYSMYPEQFVEADFSVL